MLLSIIHNTGPAVLAAALYRSIQSRLGHGVAVHRVHALLLAALTVALLSAFTGALGLAVLHPPILGQLWPDIMGTFALSSFFGLLLVAPPWIPLLQRHKIRPTHNNTAGPPETAAV